MIYLKVSARGATDRFRPWFINDRRTTGLSSQMELLFIYWPPQLFIFAVTKEKGKKKIMNNKKINK